MEQIPSAESFGSTTAIRSERPKHTDDDHRKCAYYVITDVMQSHGMTEPIQCEHGISALGAFYNEDYLWDLRVTAHRLIVMLRAANLPKGLPQEAILKEVKKLEELTR